jgi:hypothetical protein
MPEPQKAKINRDVSHIEKRVISGMEFISISDELFREYVIPVKTADGFISIHGHRINRPQWLFVRPSGTHMILDDIGCMHYVPPFISFFWKNSDDSPEANW